MDNWFTIDKVDADTWIISEYRHWEETHCYLLNGQERSLLIDTGLGICDISKIISGLTDKPVTAIATHIHWDHIGGLAHYPDFYAHEAEINWLTGGFPQPTETVRKFVTERCRLPDGFNIKNYTIFQGMPSKILHGGERIDLGDRFIKVLHTPGHSPGHLCFWDETDSTLYTGDLVYHGVLDAWFPSTDPEAYLHSLETIAALPAKQVFPAHHDLYLRPEFSACVYDAFLCLKKMGKLHHGSGTYRYDGFSVRL